MELVNIKAHSVALVFIVALLVETQICMGANFMFDVNKKEYPIFLNKSNKSVGSCKSKGNCRYNGYSDGCVYDVRGGSDGQVEFYFTKASAPELELMKSNGVIAAPSDSVGTQSLSVVVFKNHSVTVDVENDKSILLFCPHSDVNLERPRPKTPPYDKNSETVVSCPETGGCLENIEYKIELPRKHCNCFLTPGRCFLVPRLDESKHAGMWMCRSQKKVWTTTLRFRGAPNNATKQDPKVWSPIPISANQEKPRITLLLTAIVFFKLSCDP